MLLLGGVLTSFLPPNECQTLLLLFRSLDLVYGQMFGYDTVISFINFMSVSDITCVYVCVCFSG